MFRFSSRRLRAAVFVILAVIVLSYSISCTSGSSSTSYTTETTAKKPSEDTEPLRPDDAVPEEVLPPPIRSAAEVLESRYTGVEDTAEALTALEEADVEHLNPESRLIYAVLLRGDGRLEESRRELTALVEEYPSMADAWFNLALVEHADGRDAARNRALDSAIEADATLVEALTFRGDLAAADSDWSAAEASYRQALNHNDESVGALMGLAWVMARTKRVDRALPLLDRAVALEPDYTYARVDRSRVNVSLGNYNDAEDDLDVAIANEPEVPWHYLDRARIRLRHFKDYEGALEDLTNVERLDPDNFFAMVYLAGLHNEERRFSLSRQYYETVVEMRPDYIWAFRPMGKFAWMTGEYDDAADWFARASAEDSSEFSFELMTAMSLLRAGKDREAKAMFFETLRRFERGETAYEVVRFCAERGSDFYAVNALNAETNETLRERLWFYMGAIYEIEGNTIGAQAVYERIKDKRGEMEYDMAWAALNGMGGRP